MEDARNGFECEGLVLMTWYTITKPTKPSIIFAISLRRGIHICHLDGFFHRSILAGVHTGGGVSGSAGSLSKPISERLPLKVRRLVIFWPLLEGE